MIYDFLKKCHCKGKYNKKNEIQIITKRELRDEEEFFQRDHNLLREMFFVLTHHKKPDLNSLMKEFEVIKSK